MLTDKKNGTRVKKQPKKSKERIKKQPAVHEVSAA
jgi:hypothetical protein